MTYSLDKLGNNVRAICIIRGLSQRQLAKRAGLTEAAVSRIITGNRCEGVRLGSIAKIAEALDCTIEQLAGTEPFVINGGNR